MNAMADIRRFTQISTVAVTLMLSVAVPCHSATVKVSRIIDGDTFETADEERVRIKGIDSPEQHEGATQHLASLIDGKSVSLQFEGDRKDKYGRTLPSVLAGAGDVLPAIGQVNWESSHTE